MDKWINGQMDRWIDGQMNGQKDRLLTAEGVVKGDFPFIS